jgi:putative oxidoreductase
MNRNWFSAPASNSAGGLDIVRISVALILIVHGTHGLLNPKATTGFGEYLGSIGFPFGVGLAWSIMVIQIACSIALIFRRLVVPACIGHITILGMGVALIHAPSGWFVVGPGKNGMEYSITLIACLFGVLWAYWPRQQSISVGTAYPEKAI